jgi:hypothetical protein
MISSLKIAFWGVRDVRPRQEETGSHVRLNFNAKFKAKFALGEDSIFTIDGEQM